jgi:hypothetical protein
MAGISSDPYVLEVGYLEESDGKGNKTIQIGFKSSDGNYGTDEDRRLNISMSTEVHIASFVPLANVGDRIIVNNVHPAQRKNLVYRIAEDIECWQSGNSEFGEYAQILDGSRYELRRTA